MTCLMRRSIASWVRSCSAVVHRNGKPGDKLGFSLPVLSHVSQATARHMRSYVFAHHTV